MYKSVVKPLILCALFSFPSFSFANNVSLPLTQECLASVASEYDIHPDILLAILFVEGGTVGENSRANANGSYDIGLFQINSIHLNKLKGYGITEDQLRNDGCVNARVAAWHLATVVSSSELSAASSEDEYLSTLARYHSFTPQYNAIYAKRLKTAFNYLYAGEGR